MNTEYDFYTMGMRYAKEQMVNLKELSEKIGEQYGPNARMEFEAGICSLVPSYQQFQELEEISEFEGTISRDQVENATVNFTNDRRMNNSYLGDKGIGRRR